MQKHPCVGFFLAAAELRGYNLSIDNFNLRTVVSMSDVEGTGSNLLCILGSSPLTYAKVHQPGFVSPI